MSTPLEQALALLAGTQLTEEEAAQLAAAAQATVQPVAPVLTPGLVYYDRNDDLWQANPEGVAKRLTLTDPFARGTGDRDPYVGGPAPDGYGITNPADVAEVAPLRPLGVLPEAAPQPPMSEQLAPTVEPELTQEEGA